MDWLYSLDVRVQFVVAILCLVAIFLWTDR
jgi:hypothetical protein